MIGMSVKQIFKKLGQEQFDVERVMCVADIPECPKCGNIVEDTPIVAVELDENLARFVCAGFDEGTTETEGD